MKLKIVLGLDNRTAAIAEKGLAVIMDLNASLASLAADVNTLISGTGAEVSGLKAQLAAAKDALAKMEVTSETNVAALAEANAHIASGIDSANALDAVVKAATPPADSTTSTESTPPATDPNAAPVTAPAASADSSAGAETQAAPTDAAPPVDGVPSDTPPVVG